MVELAHESIMAGNSKAKFFRKVFTDDEATNRMQTNIEQAVANTIRNQLLDGRFLDVDLASGNTKVEHKLDRTPKGYLVCDRSNGSTIYTASKDDKFLTLNSSGAVTVTLWVF